MNRRFDHDCDRCRYLGEFRADSAEGLWDLYYCPHGLLGGSIIARYSSSGPDYVSMPLKLFLNNAAAVDHAGLAEAARRVREDSLY